MDAALERVRTFPPEWRRELMAMKPHEREVTLLLVGLLDATPHSGELAHEDPDGA